MDDDCCLGLVAIVIIIAFFVFFGYGGIFLLIIAGIIWGYKIITSDDNPNDSKDNNQKNNVSDNSKYQNSYYDQIYDNQPKEEVKIRYHSDDLHHPPCVDINKASINELMQLPNIDNASARDIISYTSSHEITSINQLQRLLGFSDSEINLLRPYVKFSNKKSQSKNKHERVPEKNNKENDSSDIKKEFNIKEEELKPKYDNKPPKEIPEIDINKATVDELKKLPPINIIKAKKIIQMRDNNVFFTSLDDLQQKLNLSDYEVEELRGHVIFSKVEPVNHGRVIDI